MADSHPFMAQGKDAMLEVDTTAFGNSNPFSGSGEGGHDGPPPPYESVIMHDGARADTMQQVSNAGRSHFEIVVKDPVKHGDNSMSWRRLQAYVSYKVCTNTSLSQYKNKQPEVIRRFRDFAWLRTRLQEQNRGIIIPPLPEKNVVQKYQMTTEFIETRRLALSVFINRVAAHPALAQSKDLQNFLEASEEDWAIEVARANHESAGGANSAKKTLSNTLQKLKDLGQQTQNLVSGKHTDEEEDPEYLKVREYMFQLEAHLAEAHRQAQRLIKQQAVLGASLAEFGTSVVSLGKFEQGRLADDFINLGEKAESLARSSQDSAGALGSSFEAPLKEYVRMVRSAKSVMADRGVALGTLQQARADVDAKRTKLAKLRGTPGIKEEKVSEVERELNDAQHRVEAAKGTYELIVRRMSAELARFQQERAVEMAAVLRAFAVAQATLASDTAKAWRTLAPAPSSNGSAR